MARIAADKRIRSRWQGLHPSTDPLPFGPLLILSAPIRGIRGSFSSSKVPSCRSPAQRGNEVSPASTISYDSLLRPTNFPPMKVGVQLFAVARQLAGQARIEIELPPQASVADLRRELPRQAPQLAGI